MKKPTALFILMFTINLFIGAKNIIVTAKGDTLTGTITSVIGKNIAYTSSKGEQKSIKLENVSSIYGKLSTSTNKSISKKANWITVYNDFNKGNQLTVKEPNQKQSEKATTPVVPPVENSLPALTKEVPVKKSESYTESKITSENEIKALKEQIAKYKAEIESLKNENISLKKSVSQNNLTVPVFSSPEKTLVEPKRTESKIETGKCMAITATGVQCSRSADEGSHYCWQHKTTYEPNLTPVKTIANEPKSSSINTTKHETEAAPKVKKVITDDIYFNSDLDNKSATVTSTRCKATTKAGAQCKRTVDNGSEYCWQHKKDHETKTTPSSIISTPKSSGSSGGATGTGKTIITGPRGGKYYINKNGNKTYIKR
jgi:colicin import membrane protein